MANGRQQTVSITDRVFVVTAPQTTGQ